VQRVQEAVAAAPGGTATNAAAFERHLDGIVFGDSREKGLVRGNEFVHPILRFAITFPEGWQVMNSDEQVSARESESSNRVMLLQLVQGTGNVQQLANAQMAQSGWRELGGERASINGLDAYVGRYEGVVSNTRVALQAAHVRAGNQTYVVAGLAPAQQFDAAASSFTGAIRSFRTLTQAQADAIQSDRIDFRTAGRGDTWESLARLSEGRISASTLAIINGRDAATPPKAGERLRIVVGG
jgi:predicted Zn-dependent protease